MMKRLVAFAILGLLTTMPAFAALKPGAKAPDFKARATLAGKEFDFSLADSLKKGPVVLYFYPAAFTPGCTVEAHNFAEATPKFQALGATVIGVSQDKIATLNKFSVEECRNAFPVAADTSGKISRSYEASMIGFLGYSDRTSYVIAPDGNVIYAYSALDPDHHTEYTMKAVADWAAAHKGK